MDKKQYEVESAPFWERLRDNGGDGYDDIEEAENKRWTAISAWGAKGWNLGSWPYVIVFVRNIRHTDDTVTRHVVVYVEGDTTTYACPTKEIRDAVIDSIAFFYWKHADCEWVKDYETVEQCPAELCGPYTHERQGVA